MVSLHTPLSPTRTKMMMIPDFENSSKKRKWEEESQAEEAIRTQPSKTKNTKYMFDTELHLETPLPLEWQRCLDIESGQIYFFNTRTHMRTPKDPRKITPWPPSPGHMSLDLELNLPCGSAGDSHGATNFGDWFTNSSSHKKDTQSLKRSPSWLTFEGDDNQEMVTAVCKKCHMLVMMLKASPSCPNCKFMHPPHESPRTLNPSLSLLC